MAETDNNIIESLQEQIQSWMECESWSDCPNLWENVANIMYHMFNQKNIKTPFGTKDFKKLVDLCYLKDEYGEYNYKGVFASHMLRLFLEVSSGFKFDQIFCGPRRIKIDFFSLISSKTSSS